MPELRARGASLQHQLEGTDAALADCEVCLRVADILQGFVSGLLTRRHSGASWSANGSRGCSSTTSWSAREDPPIATASRATAHASPSTREETQNDSEAHRAVIAICVGGEPAPRSGPDKND